MSEIEPKHGVIEPEDQALTYFFALEGAIIMCYQSIVDGQQVVKMSKLVPTPKVVSENYRPTLRIVQFQVSADRLRGFKDVQSRIEETKPIDRGKQRFNSQLTQALSVLPA